MTETNTISNQDELILIVDDNEINLKLLSTVLESHQYTVIVTTSGAEALTLLKTIKPHLILLDLMMPDMNGLELCQYIKADQKIQHIPIIFLTASHEEKHLQIAFQLGAVDYVRKPFKTVELLARVNVHLELQRMQKLAEAAVEAKSMFLANMSHEIRTPLNAMLGMTDFLLTTPLTQDQKDCLEIVKSSGDLLLSLVSDILDFSQLEAQELTLDLHQFDLRQLIGDIIKLTEVEAKNKNINLSAEVEPTLPQFFIGDSVRLRQIILNLVTNALKFTQVGEVTLRIIALTDINGENAEESVQAIPLRCEVQDTGIGIAPEDCHKLFQSFSQVDASTTRAYGGTGLGLAICQQMVQLIGGTIGVESQLGQGSTFWFEIKLDPSYAVDIPQWSGKRLLLVDQESPMSKLIVQHTKAWGLETVKARTLDLALSKINQSMLESCPYDWVLFNLNQFRRKTDLSFIVKIFDSLRSTSTKIIKIDHREAEQDQPYFDNLTFHASLPYSLQVSQLLAQLRNVLCKDQYESQDDSFGALLNDVTILVVDDSVFNQQVLQRQIERFGGVADYANNGQEALEYLAQQPYDLVLMDCRMPILDGYKATQVIREDSSIEQPIIIGLTANSSQEEEQKCLAVGMDEYLSKPINFSSFTRVLARWLLGDFDESTQERSKPSSLPEILNWTEELIDPDALRNLADGDMELEKQLVNLYVQEAKAYLQQGQQAIQQEDGVTVGHCAHQLKGSSVNIGAKLAAQLAVNLEHFSQKGDFYTAIDTLSQLRQVIQKIETEITA